MVWLRTKPWSSPDVATSSVTVGGPSPGAPPGARSTSSTGSVGMGVGGALVACAGGEAAGVAGAATPAAWAGIANTPVGSQRRYSPQSQKSFPSAFGLSARRAIHCHSAASVAPRRSSV